MGEERGWDKTGAKEGGGGARGREWHGGGGQLTHGDQECVVGGQGPGARGGGAGGRGDDEGILGREIKAAGT